MRGHHHNRQSSERVSFFSSLLFSPSFYPIHRAGLPLRENLSIYSSALSTDWELTIRPGCYSFIFPLGDLSTSMKVCQFGLCPIPSTLLIHPLTSRLSRHNTRESVGSRRMTGQWLRQGHSDRHKGILDIVRDIYTEKKEEKYGIIIWCIYIQHSGATTSFLLLCGCQ